MKEKNPYQVIKHQRVTEKAIVLENLKNAASNSSVARCKSPKYVFVVDKDANKQEIAAAIEEIYSEKNIKVTSVNTLNVKAKRRRVRGRSGMKASFKKAIVTLQEGDSLESV